MAPDTAAEHNISSAALLAAVSTSETPAHTLSETSLNILVTDRLPHGQRIHLEYAGLPTKRTSAGGAHSVSAAASASRISSSSSGAVLRSSMKFSGVTRTDSAPACVSRHWMKPGFVGVDLCYASVFESSHELCHLKMLNISPGRGLKAYFSVSCQASAHTGNARALDPD